MELLDRQAYRSSPGDRVNARLERSREGVRKATLTRGLHGNKKDRHERKKKRRVDYKSGQGQQLACDDWQVQEFVGVRPTGTVSVKLTRGEPSQAVG